MIKTKCEHCNREWNYRGKKQYTKDHSVWICCPVCRNQVKLKKVNEEMKETNESMDKAK